MAISCATATPLLAQRSDHPDGTIITSNMNDNTATLIDAATGRVVATLPTGEGPHEVAISHDGRWAAVSNYGVRGKAGSTITFIDVAAHRVDHLIDLHDYQRPHGMAFLPGDSMLLVTSEAIGALLQVSVRDGKVSRVLPSAGRTPHMLGLSADGSVAVSGNLRDGTLAHFRPAERDSARAIRVGAQPEGVAISPDGRTAWAGSNRDSIVVVVDLTRALAVDTLRGFGLPYRIAVTPDGRHAVITDPVRATVTIVSAATHRVERTVTIPADSLLATAEVPGSPSPEGVATSRDSRFAFVTLQGRNRVITIDLVSGAIVGSAPTGNWSDGVGFSPLRSSAQ